MIPRIYNRSYAITADLVDPRRGRRRRHRRRGRPPRRASRSTSKDGKLTHTYSMMGVFVFKQVAEEPLPDRRT